MLQWTRRRSAVSGDELAGDAAIAAALLALALIEAWSRRSAPHVSGLILLIVLYTVPLVVRRRFPRIVLLLVITCGPTLTSTVKQGGLISYVLAALLAAYTVGRLCPRPGTWWAPVLILGEGWAYFAVAAGQLSDYVYIALLYGGAWAVGLALRERATRVETLADEVAEAQALTAERARQAVSFERRRIARELHDLVSHSLSVIAIQTETVRLDLSPQDARARDGLAAVEATAHQALAEMRRLLGMLREDDEAAERQPAPGLTQLPALLAEHQRSGPPVALAVSGQPRSLPGGVDLTAYRIIQESLTNTRKHSATPGPVRLMLTYDPAGLQILLLDPGPARDRTQVTPGQGLIGMGERVALYGGSLSAGRDPNGGWRVAATLPTTAEVRG